MASMGNRRADEIWEHLVPAEWTALKPTPADDRTKKEEWIKAKYIEQLFVRPDAAKNTALQCEPDKEGWLLKWSTKSGSWKKRWFALNNGDLCYFKSAEETGMEPSGIINLSTSKLRPTNDQANCTLEVLTEHRVYVLSSESKTEMEGWVSVLNTCTTSDPLES